MTNLVPPVTLKNVLVSVKLKPNENDKYDVTTVPSDLEVFDQDTVISYQLVETNGLPIVFKSMTVLPKDNGQFSEETVSLDGKVLAFVDANTEKMTLNIKLKFKNITTQTEFIHDPQVQNNPEG
jgi:hypothetical protein